MDCGAPANIQNGKVTLASNATYYGALALYACDNNFELDGVSRRLCLENGTWSSDTPACKGILHFIVLLLIYLAVFLKSLHCMQKLDLIIQIHVQYMY